MAAKFFCGANGAERACKVQCEACAAMEKDDPNAKYLVADFTLNGTRTQVYLLNAGDWFPGFGGSRSGLVAVKTASLIVRQTGNMGLTDTEYTVNDQKVWNRIFNVAHAAKYQPQPWIEPKAKAKVPHG